MIKQKGCPVPTESRQFQIVTGALLAAAVLACAAPAQDAVPLPEFDVASVKPATPPQTGVTYYGGCRTPDPVRFECANTPFRALVMRAYGVDNYRVTGPAWIDSERFDVSAKVPEGATREQTNLMLRRLLESRFGLAVHMETRDLQMFALTVGKNGSKLKEWKEGDTVPPPPGNMAASPADGGTLGVLTQQTSATVRQGAPSASEAPRTPPSVVRTTMSNGVMGLEATRMTISGLARTLENQLGHHVVDETGLTGFYNVNLRFSTEGTAGANRIVISGGGSRGAPPADFAPEPAPSIFTAVQDQLGLKLEPKKVPTEVVVVDQAAKVPSAN